jgi:cobalt-zinc-cadmium efflux system protein
MHAHHHHPHGDQHAHSHAHAPAGFGRAFAIGIGLNLAFVAIEVIYGIYGHSVALLSDAGHNLGDDACAPPADAALHLRARRHVDPRGSA